MSIKTLKDLKNIRGKMVLVRVDFNVPLEKRGEASCVADDSRIRAAIPTIECLRNKGARVILMSHLGDPKGKVKEDLRLAPVADTLRKFFPEAKEDIGYISSWDLKDVAAAVRRMRDGEILLLENLRFMAGEEKNSPAFAKSLAKLAHFYVNDAFSACHRKHASLMAITKFLPSYAGLALEKEIEALDSVLKHPKPPFLFVMGGAKISTKIGAIKFLLKKADYALIGGALANTFLKASGFEVGASLYDASEMDIAKELLESPKIVLPSDAVVAEGVEGKPKVKDILNIGKREMILDIGPETVRRYAKLIREAQTFVWNGPLGYYEKKAFSHGSVALARLMASRASGRAFGVAGGGETLDILGMTGMGKYFDHVSMGGGAMIQYLEGKSLPAIKALLS